MKIIHVNKDSAESISFSIEEVLPIRKENLTNQEDPQGGEFMGICGFYDDLKNFFWLHDNIHFVLTTIQGASLGTFLVNTLTHEIARFAVNETLSDVF